MILTGGLGPTEDDVTREAVADALGRELVFSQEIRDAIDRALPRLKRKMADNQSRQAYRGRRRRALAESAAAPPPASGSKHDGRVVMLLPGPPQRTEAAVRRASACRGCERTCRAQVIRTRFYRVAGMGESDLDQLIAPVYTKLHQPGDHDSRRRPATSRFICAPAARPAEEAEALLAEVGPPIEELLGDRIYSRNGDTLEAVVGALLRERDATLSVAESCTGGMLGERITSVAGSSDYFVGGFLVYTDRMKTDLLGVDPALIAQHTAVSEEVARAMAEGAQVPHRLDLRRLRHRRSRPGKLYRRSRGHDLSSASRAPMSPTQNGSSSAATATASAR